jgi:stringent starvation protein B
MVSTKPYLIRAIYEWCADQGYTPYLAVQVDESTRVPREFVRDGQIVLNVSPDATHQMLMGNDEITFQTRFNGASFPVVVPVEAVLAIYARENGQGMAFEVSQELSEAAIVDVAASVEEGPSTVPEQVSVEAARQEETAPKRGAHLTRIK